jgi:hypothetical protein
MLILVRVLVVAHSVELAITGCFIAADYYQTIIILYR